MISRISRKRILFINLAVAAIFPLIIFQIFRLTVQQQDFFLKRASLQHDIVIPMKPERGSILDRNHKEFASNLQVPSVYAVPRSMKASEKSRLIKQLSEALDLSPPFVKKRLDRDKAFVWIKRHASVTEADAVRALGSSNLGVTYEPKRFYPNGEMLSQVIGFGDVDNVGVEGLELLYDDKLKGRPGFRRTKRDARGREVVALEEKLVPPVNGSNLVLTIDQYIQHLTDEALRGAYEKWKAKSAVAVVMNPHTGEILAMSTQPAFDPNDRNASAVADRRNRPITDIFEPGSVFKVLTASAALNEGVVTLSDQFDCEQGEWQVRRRRTIHDVHPYGMLTFPEVLIKSSNIGIVKVAQELGEKRLHDYIRQFGFGQKTGIDFPGEVRGIFRPVEKWSKYSITSIPYGQEVAATAVQMLRAVSVLANGGALVKPYLLREIRDQHDVVLIKNEPVVSEAILKPEVAGTITGIMERVVNEGTGKRARIEGVRVAGKTGTTQKLNPTGGYSHDHFIGSFVGFAPAEEPMLAMIVSIDDPKPYYYGGTVAAPVFREVMERSLLYLGHIPDDATLKTVSSALINRHDSSPAFPKNQRHEFQGVSPQVH